MKARRGRWVGAIIAFLVVGVIGIASLGAGKQPSLPSGMSGSAATAGSAVPGIGASTAFDFLWKFAIVVALLGASLWLLRRYAGTTQRARGRTGAINVVDTISLAQGRAIYILDLGDRALIVGATAQQLTALGDVTNEAVLLALRAQHESQTLPLGAVARLLNPKRRLDEARRLQRLEAVQKTAAPEPVSEAKPAPAPRPNASTAPVAPGVASAAGTPAAPVTLESAPSEAPRGEFSAALAGYLGSVSDGRGDGPKSSAAQAAHDADATPEQAAFVLRALAERLRARRRSA